jgi:hypothetical protein
MGGNFSMAPAVFEQVYAIRASVGGAGATRAYAYMARKTQAAREALLRAISNRGLQRGLTLAPDRVSVDFELAAINAAGEVFGESSSAQGCYFHFTQAAWGKIQGGGMAQLYMEDEAAKLFFGKMAALAFLPTGDVGAGMAHVRQSAPPGVGAAVGYFDATYVSGAGGNQPRFPPAIWNARDATATSGHRANNVSEGWNNAFFQLVGHKRPSVWQSIAKFRQDAAIAEALVGQVAVGNPPKKRCKKSLQDSQRRTQQLCLDYSSGAKDAESFPRGRSRSLRL